MNGFNDTWLWVGIIIFFVFVLLMFLTSKPNATAVVVARAMTGEVITPKCENTVQAFAQRVRAVLYDVVENRDLGTQVEQLKADLECFSADVKALLQTYLGAAEKALGGDVKDLKTTVLPLLLKGIDGLPKIETDKHAELVAKIVNGM